jgi:alpha-tubulin suppressor-like RCC1 family protein
VNQDYLELDLAVEPVKIQQIEAGEKHSLVLFSNGLVYSFGYNQQG